MFTMSANHEKGSAYSLMKIKQTLKHLVEFIHVYHPVLSKNLVGFLTENLWQLIPLPIQSELLNLSSDALCDLPVSENTTEIDCDDLQQRGSAGHPTNLEEFKRQFSSSRLENMHVLALLGEITKPVDSTMQNDKVESASQPQNLTSEARAVRPKTNTFMTEKKSHEVDILANVIAVIAKNANIQQIVDVGSGKGYLGQHLALYHSLNVLGIDSSQTNSHGAKVRGQKMKKQQPGQKVKSEYMKKEELGTCSGLKENNSVKSLKENNSVKSMSLHSNTSKCLCWRRSASKVQEKMLDDKATEITPIHHNVTIKEHNSNDIQVESSSGELQLVHQTETTIQPSQSSDCSFSPQLASTSMDDQELNNTNKITSRLKHCDLDVSPQNSASVCHICNKNFEQENECKTGSTEKKNMSAKAGVTSLYQPITAFVDASSDFNELLGDNDIKQKVLLSGLHTCGDLSSSMLRLFVTSPSAHILCNVPCCYHLLTEEFELESKVHDGKSEAMQIMQYGKSEAIHFGFPMSDYLRSQKTQIGCVARMVACMAADKLAHEKQLPTEKLFYRAVLQVILKENYTIPSRQQKTGKLASKCKTFVEYTRRALKKMGFEESKLSGQEIQQYYDTHKPEIKKLAAFHQFRATLAPSIEALILLDKLCFLKEQDSIKEAYLVRLFDPVTSPRCHAIIATK